MFTIPQFKEMSWFTWQDGVFMLVAIFLGLTGKEILAIVISIVGLVFYLREKMAALQASKAAERASAAKEKYYSRIDSENQQNSKQ